MLWIIRIFLVGFTTFFSVSYFKDLALAKKAGTLEDTSVPKGIIVGFVTDFFDTLGIGSFAPTVALSNALKMNIPDRLLPGTLNVCHTIPVVIEALIFTTVIKIDPFTLICLVVAAVIGSYIGAGIIAKMNEKIIQIIMGIALAITAVLMFLALPALTIGGVQILPEIGLMPGGGDAIGLTGVALIIGVVGNFILGALMTAGVGLYAPCMAMVYFLGLSPAVAFPVMMCSCAMLMPVASTKFIKENSYSKKASILITIGGVVGVLVAAFIVKSLPIDILKWLVVFVVAYTSVTMLLKAFKPKKA